MIVILTVSLIAGLIAGATYGSSFPMGLGTFLWAVAFLLGHWHGRRSIVEERKAA